MGLNLRNPGFRRSFARDETPLKEKPVLYDERNGFCTS